MKSFFFNPLLFRYLIKIKFRLIFLLVHALINCSSIICPSESNQSSICPPDSHFIEDLTTVISSSTSLSSLNSTSLCCSRRGHCVCSSCRKTFCGENSILQIYRTGDPSQPGQCCDQFNCIKSR